ncbi:hypothetical protein C8T65DRAFT_738849 [Cerioporus squamosus]|nr:hypothetical protein C8T65DRAFT_738849 [Cerioporus squamosus]
MSSTPATQGGASPPFSPLADLSIVPTLDSFIGAWLVGTFASATLQGVLFVQTYSYFRGYPNDPRFVKIWVIVVFLVELTTTIFSMHSCYFYLVTNYLNAAALLSNIVWSMKILLTFGLFACCIALSVLVWNEPNALSPERFSWLASAIAQAYLGMPYSPFLSFACSGSWWHRANSILDFLVLYAVSSGLVLCTVNILNAVCALALPKTLAYSATSLVLTKLYSITFMVWLNAREPLRDRGIVMVETDIFTSVIAIDAQYPSEGVAERTVRFGLSRPTATSLSLAGLQDLSQSSGDLSHRSDTRGGSEKAV